MRLSPRTWAGIVSLGALVFVPRVAGQGIPGSGQSNPFVERSAGRAFQRLFFGVIDCGQGLSEASNFCPDDAFSQSGVFVNGTYRGLKFLYGGEPLGTLSTAEALPALISQVLDFPQPSSASGFTFTLGRGAIPTPASSVYGGLFGEQGLTNGKAQLSLGLSFQSQTLDSYAGQGLALDEGGVPFGEDAYLTSEGVAYGYVARFLVRLRQDVLVGAASYGLTSRLDLRISAPLVRTQVEGSNEILDYARFSDGTLSADFADTGFSAQGRYYVRGESTALGDLDASLKLALTSSQRLKFALVAGGRLGTGSQDKLSGTGTSRPYGGIALSVEENASSLYVDVKGAPRIEDVAAEWVTVIGTAQRLVRDRLTLTAECYWRRQQDVPAVVSSGSFGSLESPVTGGVFDVRNYTALSGTNDTILLAPGVKARLGGRLLLSAFGVIPLTQQGLQYKTSFNIGLNYLF